MNLYRYTANEIKKELKKVAKELCKKLAPTAVEISVIDPLNNVKIFLRCTEEVQKK